jgi:putative lipoic acid-binding regulatory protein
MGTNVDGFVDAVLELAQRHDPGFDPATVERRPSKGGNYLVCHWLRQCHLV